MTINNADVNIYEFENGTAFVEPMEQLKKEIEDAIKINQNVLLKNPTNSYLSISDIYQTKINELEWVLSRIKELQK
jgi:hypothetical protein